MQLFTSEKALGAAGLLSSFLNPHYTYKFLVEAFAQGFDPSYDFLKQKNIFLVTSTGRTGTLWLNNLLGSVKGVLAAHEPVPFEQIAQLNALLDESVALEYLTSFRVREIALRCKNREFDTYGEVNGALRRHVPALRQLFPQMKFVHIVRNARTFIESVMQRNTFTESDKINEIIDPPVGYFTKSEWSEMSRFEKICWVWKCENEFLSNYCDKTLRFEDITTSYSHFKEELSDYLSVDICRDDWEAVSGKRVNQSSAMKISRDEIWTEENEVVYELYCSDLMAQLGYGLF